MQARKAGGDASDPGHPQPCWAPSLHRRRGWGLAGRAAWGAPTPPILGEEGDGAVWQHPPPQHTQPWEHSRNLGLGMAGENTSCVKCLQCRGDPRNLQCRSHCQSMQRIPMPQHGQETELFGELNLATALSVVAFGDKCVTLGAAECSHLHPAHVAFHEPISRMRFFPALFPNKVPSHTKTP